MIKEIEIVEKEFISLLPNIDTIWFHRFYGYILTPYFKLDNGKKNLIDIIKILHSDRFSDYTILNPKPGLFKTYAQEEFGSDYKIIQHSNITISDFRSPDKSLDLINDYHFLPLYNNKDTFNNFLLWIDSRYEFLSEINNYNSKKITLKNLRKLFNKTKI